MTVYFIQVGDAGPIKIGHARTPMHLQSRLAAVNTHHFEVARIIAVRRDLVGCQGERSVHAALAVHRIKGEWFWPTPPVIAEARKGQAVEIPRGIKGVKADPLLKESPSRKVILGDAGTLRGFALKHDLPIYDVRYVAHGGISPSPVRDRILALIEKISLGSVTLATLEEFSARQRANVPEYQRWEWQGVLRNFPTPAATQPERVAS